MNKRQNLGLSLMLSSALALAGEAPQTLLCHTDAYPPYVIGEGQTLRGSDPDILREAARRLNLPLEFQLMPWKRLESDLRQAAQSAVECAFSFSHTPERTAYMTFTSVPLHVTMYTLFVRDQPSAPRSFAELAGRNAVIGVRRGFRLPEEIVKGVQAGQYRLVEENSDTSNLRLLEAGVVDAVLSNAKIVGYSGRTAASPGMHALPGAAFPLPTFLIFNKAKPAARLAPEFDRVLQQMHNDGTLQIIRAKYP